MAIMAKATATVNSRRGRRKKQTPKGRARPARIRIGTVVEMVDPNSLMPAMLNDRIYKLVSSDDPAVIDLSRDMAAKKQVLEALVVTLDDVIVSGHRRRAAAELAGFKEVPVRRINIRSDDPRFESYLVAFNHQRVKTLQEQIREEVIRTSPEDAYKALLQYRVGEMVKVTQRADDANLRVLDRSHARQRSAISDNKQKMLQEAISILEQYRDYWPLTLRQIHYRMLGRGVLRNSKDPKSTYVNTQKCYKDLSNLLTRARLDWKVPWESMHDPTRPRTRWQLWENAAAYTRKQLDEFLCTYRRNLLQSQPAYVELVVEKLTVYEIARRAASQYHVPVGVGRGYSSVTSLEETAERYKASGKDSFILLIASDFDPEGEDITRTWDACLRDEHSVSNLTTIKVAVNPDQVTQYSLSPLPMKASSSRAAGFEACHGGNVYELEAFEPDQLQAIIQNAIRGVLDLDLFAKEQAKEAEEARYLVAARNQVQEMLKTCDLLGGSGEERGSSEPREQA
jgi:hypothetical protein